MSQILSTATPKMTHFVFGPDQYLEPCSFSIKDAFQNIKSKGSYLIWDFTLQHWPILATLVAYVYFIFYQNKHIQ